MTKEEFQEKCTELADKITDTIRHPMFGCQAQFQADYEAVILIHDPLQVIEVFTVWYNKKQDEVMWCKGQLPPRREKAIN